MLKMGRAPRGSVTFLVPVGRTGSSRIQGRPVAAGDVVVLFDGEELDYRSSGPARLVSVSIERTALEGHVRGLLGRHIGELRLQGRLSGLRTNLAILRRLCREVAVRAATNPRLLRDAALASGLERKLVKVLLSRVREAAGAGGPEPQPHAGPEGRGLAAPEPRRAADDRRPLRRASRQRADAPRGLPRAPGHDTEGLRQGPALERGPSGPLARPAEDPGDRRRPRLGLSALRLVLAGLPPALRRSPEPDAPARSRGRRPALLRRSRERAGRRGERRSLPFGAPIVIGSRRWKCREEGPWREKRP